MSALRLSLPFVCAIAPAWLQASGVCGHVVALGGLAVPQARILVTHADSGLTANTVTLADGVFSFPDLPSGDYTITVEAEGYEPTLPVAYRVPGDPLELSLEPHASAIQLQAFIFESPADQRPLVGPRIDFGPAAEVAVNQDPGLLPARVYTLAHQPGLKPAPADRVGVEWPLQTPLSETHLGTGLDTERLLPSLWFHSQTEGLLHFHAAYQATPAEAHTTDFLSPFDPIRGPAAEMAARRNYRGNQLHHRWSSTLSYNLNHTQSSATALSLTYSGLGPTLSPLRDTEAAPLVLTHSLDLGLRQNFRLWNDQALTFTLDLLNIGGLVGGLNSTEPSAPATTLQQMTQNNEDWEMRLGMSLDF